MRGFLGVTMAVALVATPAIARTVTADDAAQFQVGSATVDDGKPGMDEVDSDGTRTIKYVSIHAHPKAASFVPVVGLFAGGARGSSSTVSFTFGPDGKLKSHSSSTTNIDCGAAITGSHCGGG